MVRFDSFERQGVAVAAISDMSDGDCGRHSPNQESAQRARSAFCAQLGIDAATLVCAEQVHGAVVVQVRAEDSGRGVVDGQPARPGADGLLTEIEGLPLAMYVADCVPVYLFDSRLRVGGILHAGRAGTRLNICAAAIGELGRLFGTSPSDVHALIGPSAGPCCYEVSEEIAADFVRRGLPVQGRRLDLWQANARQLTATGVPQRQIEIVGCCTICDGSFYSYRKGAQTARNMAVMVI